MAPVPDTHPDSLTTALALAEFGFGVFSVWGIKDGICRCPKGAKCDQKPGKHPIPPNGFKAASLDPDRIRAMLRAAGSAGNYGVCPAENTIIIDVDGEGWREKLATLGLPKTLAVLTGNGIHLYFYWPAKYGPAPTHLFGWKVRSIAHMGYTLGPGSLHESGVYYRFAHQNGHTNEEMVATIKPFPAELVPQEKPKANGLVGSVASITVGGAVEPETIMEGGRYDYLRDRARPLWGIGLSGEALFNAVDAFNQRFPVPHDRATVERAIDESRLNRNFQRDAPTYVPPAVIPPGLFTRQPDYHKQNAAVPTYVSPLVAYGTVTLISGPPKGGKSTLISNLLAARQNGTVFLWGDPVPQGPMALVTEEGGYPVVRKTQGLAGLDILDRMAFVVAGLKSLDHLLAALDAWVATQEGPALVVIDTLAVWGDIKDENDATAATNAITALRVWAQHTGSAVVLVHHTRKGGGDHGEAIRGSGGIFAAVDQSVELAFTNDKQSDDRGLDIAGRLTFGETKTLAFDRPTMTYSVTTRVLVEKYPTDKFPVDGSSQMGCTNVEAGGVWGMSPASANKHLKELTDSGVLVARFEQSPGSRAKHLVYVRARPLLDLDNRSVGEQMADIFAKD
jgi:hypothetical protein